VGVLDLVGFTERIAAESASVAFNALGEIWAAFDGALDKFHCQRVKTNGIMLLLSFVFGFRD
jgi:hypothetical protein